jgi:SAM-dependent methyltransferase
MQENRFDWFMNEWQGLTELELKSVLAACRDAVLFQLTFLPGRRPVVPISTLMASFTIYNKLVRCNPQFCSVLEIGPGCGYLSFFLKQHRALSNYSQIEVCESFYLMQNLVNLYCFGPCQDERAMIPESASLQTSFANARQDLEIPPRLRGALPEALCVHYPWWRIGELREREDKFDFVTVNAAIMEMDPHARDDYITVIGEVLKDDGAFLMQCPGMNVYDSLEDFLAQMYRKGFAVLMFDVGDAPVGFPLPGPAPEGTAAGDALTRKFALGNAMFVKGGHPLFERYHRPELFTRHMLAPEDVVRRTFFDREGERRVLSRDEMLAQVDALFTGQSVPQ